MKNLFSALSITENSTCIITIIIKPKHKLQSGYFIVNTQVGIKKKYCFMKLTKFYTMYLYK